MQRKVVCRVVVPLAGALLFIACGVVDEEGGVVCGDGICAASESPETCPADCAEVIIECGDGVCHPTERASCPQDCADIIIESECGDGVCHPSERASCPQDCAEVIIENECGDGVCHPSERGSCPQDCGEPLVECGDGVCYPGEEVSCPQDCQEPTIECGDGVCHPGEEASCPQDCDDSVECGPVPCAPGPGCAPECECEDSDGDGVCDVDDNCPSVFNPEQEDSDGDGVGDACDVCPGGDDRVDEDGNGVPDDCERCAWGMTRGRFVVTWHDVPHFSDPELFSFQVVLHEDGTIAFQYDHMHSWFWGTIGMEDGLGDFYVQYESDTLNILDQTRLQWTPDGEGGYVLERSLERDGPPFEWLFEAGASQLPLGDDASQEVELPFAFPFQGRTYTRMHVSSNGYVWFGNDTSNCCLADEESLPTGRSWEAMIAPLWDDWNPAAGGHVHVHSSPERCVDDCAGVPGGYARRDDCGTCFGGTTGVRERSEMDCAGVCFGEAYQDRCGSCAGGTSGRVPEQDDRGCGCFEDPPGPWYPDVDGDGLGAGEPVMACEDDAPPGYVDNNDDPDPDCATNDTSVCGLCGGLDCDGVCGGEAFVDACGVCAGGTTGRAPIEDGERCVGPDLIVDRAYIGRTMYVDHVFIHPDDCYLLERCVLGSGERRVLRFGTIIANIGTADLVLGAPGGAGWVYDECHQHYHYEDHSHSQLFTPSGAEVRALGVKNGWCLMDVAEYGASGVSCDFYTCSAQGISAGCADVYTAGLPCQWIDVTGVPDGEYVLRVTTNPDRRVYELDYTNNSAEVRIRLEGDSVTWID
jgi:hypothetical protein